MQKSKEADSTNADSTPQLEATKLVVLDDAEGASSSPDDHTKQFKLLKIRTMRKIFSYESNFLGQLMACFVYGC